MFAKVRPKCLQKCTKNLCKSGPKCLQKCAKKSLQKCGKKKLFCKSTPKVCQKYFCLHSHVISFLFTITEATLHTELFTTQWYIKSKKSQKWPFPSIQNQDSSNQNKICKILTHRGMVCSCVLNRYIEKLGFSIVKLP